MKIKIGIIILLLTQITFTKGQSFNYNLSKDSSVYTPLVSPILVGSNESWKNKQFGIKIPFGFSICKLMSDSLIIENNGYIEFENARSLSILSFNNFTSNKDTNNLYNSLISYEITGLVGNRIMKIQYSNLSQYILSQYDYLNYQVWLFESGSIIEFHIGSNSYNGSENTSSASLGLINRNMNFESINGLILYGHSSSAQLQAYTIETPELGFLSNIPSQGIVYRLTPTY